MQSWDSPPHMCTCGGCVLSILQLLSTPPAEKTATYSISYLPAGPWEPTSFPIQRWSLSLSLVSKQWANNGPVKLARALSRLVILMLPWLQGFGDFREYIISRDRKGCCTPSGYELPCSAHQPPLPQRDAESFAVSPCNHLHDHPSLVGWASAGARLYSPESQTLLQ